MGIFFAEYGVEILLSLMTAGSLAFCRFVWKQLQIYQKLLEEREDHEIDTAIDKKLEPIYQELEDIRSYLRKKEELQEQQLSLLLESYKFRLVQLCKIYLQQNYMTQDQYDQLTEFYKLYSGLGGNDQGEEYYKRTIILPIRPAPEK